MTSICEPPKTTKKAERLHTFDVFDTVLTRMVGDPKSIFLFVGKEAAKLGLIECSPIAFQTMRVTSERRAHAKHAVRSSLKNIYDELAVVSGISIEKCEAIKELEIETESRLLLEIPKNSELIKQLSQQGERVAFISDMYLPKDVIQRLIEEKTGLRSELYVSADHGHSKHSGELFDFIRNDNNLAEAECHHFGNDAHADVKMARSRGWQAEHFAECELNEFERVLESHAARTDGWSSLLAGASRAVRNSMPCEGRDAAIRDVAAGVAAPLLVSYVTWILRTAKRLGLRQLFFMSRDGEVLLEIARKLCCNFDYDIELNYFYGGRQIWYLCHPHKGAEALLKDLLELVSSPRRTDLLARLPLHADHKKALGEKCGWTKSDLLKVATIADVTQIIYLCTTGDFALHWHTAIEEHRRLAHQYLVQSGVKPELGAGFVDIGWVGRVVDSVDCLLIDNFGKGCTKFFFGLTPSTPCVKDSYTFSCYNDLPYYTSSLLEMFCVGSHNVITGFESHDGTLHPIGGKTPNRHAFDWGFHSYRDAVMHYTDILSPYWHLSECNADLSHCCLATTDIFWRKPTFDIATRWGDFPYEEDPVGLVITPLAKKMNALDFMRGILYYLSYRPMDVYWQEGTYARSWKPMVVVYTLFRATARKLHYNIHGVIRRALNYCNARNPK